MFSFLKVPFLVKEGFYCRLIVLKVVLSVFKSPLSGGAYFWFSNIEDGCQCQANLEGNEAQCIGGIYHY